MVTRDVSQAANEIEDILENRSPTGLGFVAVSTVGGTIAAQEVADRIMPFVVGTREPDTTMEFLASSGIKGGTAAGIGTLITRTQITGLPLLVASFAGVGALAGAGADFVNAVQRSNLLAEMPGASNARRQASSSSSSSSSTSTSSTSTTRRSTSPSPSANGQATDVTV